MGRKGRLGSVAEVAMEDDFVVDVSNSFVQRVSKLSCYILYAVYILFGLILAIVGAVLMSKSVMAKFCWSVLLLAIVMIIVGAANIFFLNKDWEFFLRISIFVNLALFGILLSISISALYISAGNADPVQYAWDEVWDEFRESDGLAKYWGYCFLSSWREIDVGDTDGADAWPKCSHLYYDPLQNNNPPNDIPECVWENWFAYVGDCEWFEEDGLAFKDAVDQYLTDSSPMLAYEDCDGTKYPYISTFFDSSPSTVDGETALNACYDCNVECKENLVAMTISLMKPAAVAAFALLFFFVTVVAVNVWTIREMSSKAEISFVLKMAVLGLNGLVLILGLVIFIVSIVAVSKVKSDCPLEPQRSCPTMAIYILMMVGGGFIIVPGFVIFGLLKNMDLMLMISNLVYMILDFALLLVTIGLALATGILGQAATSFEENWEEARDGLRNAAKHADVCQCDVNSDAIMCNEGEMYQMDCIEAIQDIMEGYMTTLGIFTMAACGAMLLNMVATYYAIGSDEDGAAREVDDEIEL